MPQYTRYGPIPEGNYGRGQVYRGRHMGLVGHGHGRIPRRRANMQTLPLEILASIMTMCRVEDVVKLEQVSCSCHPG
jgi:hypothetical protein